MLSQDQLDAFARDGFLSYGKILSDDEIALLRDEYDREFARAEAGGHWRNIAAAANATVAEQKVAPQRMLQIMQMCDRNIHFRKLLYDSRILDVIADLMGPSIMLFHDQALFKPPHHGGPVTWHQDNAYWHARPANLVSCWLTLDDVDRDNGAMQLIPGSHLRPVWHEQRTDNVLLDVERQVDTSKAVVVELPAGGCMFHHCQTLHYTAPNRTDRQRRSYAIHFMPPGTTRNGEVMRPSFSRPILRMGV
jgi:phytanoyl-CoA hydroxylase